MAKRRYGTGHVFQRGRTFWIAYHVDGKLVRESAKTGVRKDAEALLRERLHNVDLGSVTAAAATTTLADLERLVLDDHAANGRRSAKNAKASFRHLKAGLGGGDRKAREITVASVERYKAGRLKAKAAVATVNRECAYLRRGFRLAVRQGMLASRPDFSLLHESNARRGFFEAEQFASLVKHLPDWLAPVARFAYVTGWRRSEMLSLQWANVDRKHKVIRIERTKNDEARTLPYGSMPDLGAVIAEQWKAHEALLAKGTICPFVFQRAGSRLHEFAAEWKAACRAAGVPGRLLHDMRRTAVRNLERAGVSRSVAMKVTGHKTESVYKRYAIVAEKDIADGLAKLAAQR